MKNLNQLLFNFNYSQNFNYDDFFVSKSNYFAFQLIEKWPKWEKNILNICGEKFSGKSHLANIFCKKNRCIKITEEQLNDEILKKNKDLNKIIEGIEIIKKDLISIFKKNGIHSIDCINKKFDPNFHQAMMEVEDSTKDTGTVLQEIQKGYMMKDRLLRPSLVGVTKKREKNAEKTTKKQNKTSLINVRI